MSDRISEDIMDKLKKICLCKGITRATIKIAIKNGARSVEEVQKITGAGLGACSGRRCTEKIHEIIMTYDYDV